MDVSAVIAIVGGIALLVGILGGGIEAERIKIPTIPKYPRLLSGVIGIVLIATSVWLSQFSTEQSDKNTQNLSTSTPPAVSAISGTLPVDSASIVVSTINPYKVVFSMENATEQSFYQLGKANFIFDNEKSLIVQGAFYEGIYLRKKMPKNFRAMVSFTTGSTDCQFIIGISDGVNWRPNYHFVMYPDWSAFKKQIIAEENWDHYLTTIDKGGTTANSTIDVEFERSEGNIKVFFNGSSAILFGDASENINKYNYLYFTGDDQRQPYIIKSLIIEDLDG